MSSKVLAVLALVAGFLLSVGAAREMGVSEARATLRSKDDEFQSLAQEEFSRGTYRIKTAGKYKLTSDIVFSPRPDNDFWNVPGDAEYPMGQFYLGFFAAITIEADDVELDLNGFSISMGREFYLLQRFFNVIEMNDRVFIDNQGVSSLNFQAGDKFQDRNGTLPGIVMPSRVHIHNGTIGLSSHAGIHGNGVRQVTINNLAIENFEVAGIQCNGCHHVAIHSCRVGPSSREVPVLATFANARFLDLMLNRFVPHGLAREGLSRLLSSQISYADRPDQPQTLAAVFSKLHKAATLFRQHYMGRTPLDLSAEDKALQKEAIRVFSNRAQLPDGAVLYGILLNHLGTPDLDQNFFGSGSEARDVEVVDTVVRGLKASPVEVPALQHASGKFAQGPHRDLLQVVDMASDGLNALVNSEYKGSFLDDVYFAMWQLSNDYYKARLYASDCGNFASNATMPFSSDWQGKCSAGHAQDASLRGRDVTMLQKKYFGGLSMSQGLFEWATVAGRSLHTLFVAAPDSDSRRATGHTLKCDHDTMFHANHGVVGIKLQETLRAKLRRVNVSDVRNTGDGAHWICSEKFEFQENSQPFAPTHKASNAGADVRGVEIVRCDDVELSALAVRDLDSDEGLAIGLEVSDETNDRSDYHEVGVRMELVSIASIRAGRGSQAIPTRLADKRLAAAGGITIGDAEDLQNNFRQPKHLIHYGWSFEHVGPGPIPILNPDPDAAIGQMLSKTKYSTEAAVAGFRAEAIGFFQKQFGLSFPDDWRSYSVRQQIPVSGLDGKPGAVFLPLSLFDHVTKKATSYCGRDAGCTAPRNNAKLFDTMWGVAWIYGEGATLGGVFGGDQGQFVSSNATMLYGVYSIENLPIPGVTDRNVEVKYFSLCPLEMMPSSDGSRGFAFDSFYVNCGLESDLFGRGHATGHYVFAPDQTGQRWKSVGQATMIFDDSKLDPRECPVRSLEATAQHSPSPAVHYTIIMDGTHPVDAVSSGADVAPMLFQHHFSLEAGVNFLRRTSLGSDSAMRALRRSFLERLRDEWGIAHAVPEEAEDMPLESVVDLGGGNVVVAYEVNKRSNLRFLTKKRDEQTLQFEDDSRLHEGGFKLSVGPAGIVTNRGYLPFASMIMQGVFLIDNDPDFGQLEVTFHSLAPVKVNPYKTASVVHAIDHPYYGPGLLGFTVSPTMPSAEGLRMGGQGYMIFESGIDAAWLTAFLDQPLHPPPDSGSDRELITAAVVAGGVMLVLVVMAVLWWVRPGLFECRRTRDRGHGDMEMEEDEEWESARGDKEEHSLGVERRLAGAVSSQEGRASSFSNISEEPAASEEAAHSKDLPAVGGPTASIQSTDADLVSEHVSRAATSPAESVVATDFFRNKGVLVTGATGFIGKVVVEKLLRSFDLGEHGTLFLLIRASSPEQAQQRLHDDVLSSEVWSCLRAARPDFEAWVNGKICAVACDLEGGPGLGLSDADRCMLTSRTHVVLHMAANVRFESSLRSAAATNVHGALNVLRLARECALLESMVHVSTAYVNCNRPSGSSIAEKIYLDDGRGKLFEAETELAAVMSLPDAAGCKEEKATLRGWPNSYAFSKFLAEHLVAAEATASGIPLSICRPSIVGAAAREPLPGWIDSKFGIAGGILAVGFGAKQLFYARGETNADIIPVDACCNGILLAAASRPELLRHSTRTASENPYATTVPVVHLASSSRHTTQWVRFFNDCAQYYRAVPLSKQAARPDCYGTTSLCMYHVRMGAGLELPRMILQCLAKCGGAKVQSLAAQLGKQSHINHKVHTAFKHFLFRTWRFESRATTDVLLPASERCRHSPRPSPVAASNHHKPATTEHDPLWADVCDLDWTGYALLFSSGLQRFLVKDWTDAQQQRATASEMLPEVLAVRALPLRCGGVLFSPSADPVTFGSDSPAGRSAAAGLSWSAVTYSVTVRGQRKPVLRSVSGAVLTGEVVAVLGPSGSGKTSLLSVLADRVDTRRRGRRLAASVKLNGAALSGPQLREHVGFVAQEDVLLGAFTVRETLSFGAGLSLPATCSREERETKVEEALDDMGLRGCQHARVGDVFFKGISGGEKRRLSIALELLRSPPVLVLDEPTSGLDSASAMVLLCHLKHLAASRRTAVVLSIHQPSAPMMRLFDAVLYMAKGHTVYAGPPGPPAIDYFASLGHPCPRFENPSDFHLALINSDFKRVSAPTVAASVRASEPGGPQDQTAASTDSGSASVPAAGDVRAFAKCFRASNQAVALRQRVDACGSHASLNAALDGTAPAPLSRQLATMMRRFALNNARNPAVFLVRLLMHVVLSTMVGLFYFKDSFRSYLDLTAMLFSHFAYLSLLCVAALPALADLRLVFQRERASWSLSVPACVVSQFVCGLPMVAVNAAASTAPMLYSTGLETAFSQYALTMFLALAVSESWMHLIGAVSPNFMIALAVAACLYGIFMMTSGFLMAAERMPAYLRWMNSWSFMTYAFEALISDEFSKHDDPEAVAMLVAYGADDVDIAHNRLALCVYALALQVVFGLVVYLFHTARH